MDQIQLRVFQAPTSPNPNSTNSKTCGKCERKRRDLPSKSFQFVLLVNFYFFKGTSCKRFAYCGSKDILSFLLNSVRKLNNSGE